MQIKQGNNTMACGKATADAVLTSVGATGSSLTKFCIVVASEKGNRDATVFLNVAAWHEVARYAKNIKKGDSVMVMGTLSSREFNGKTYTDCNADFVQIQSKTGEVSGGGEDMERDIECANKPYTPVAIDEDSLPF